MRSLGCGTRSGFLQRCRLNETNLMPSSLTLSENETIGRANTAPRNTASIDGKGFTAHTFGRVEIYRPDGTRITFSRIALAAISALEEILSHLGTGRIKFSDPSGSMSCVSERTNHTSTPRQSRKKSINTTKRNYRDFRSYARKVMSDISTSSPTTEVPRQTPQTMVEAMDQLDTVTK